MATNTPLQSITLTSATQYVYFTNISQNYTDLIVVASVRQTTANQDGYLRFNGDNSSIYADQVFRANGSAASATKDDSAAGIDIGVMPTSSSAIGVYQALTLNVMNYTNTNMYKSVFIRTGNDSYTHQLIGTWRSTDAITSLSLESRNSGYFAAGSTFDLYGIKSGAQKATGGDVVVTDGTYWYHAFKASGTFTPAKVLSADVLVIAGGGGAAAGGGGAGGLLSFTGQSLSATNYTVTVGAGGSASISSNGSDSTFQSLTSAVGGGNSGNWSYSVASGNGGSGGGAFAGRRSDGLSFGPNSAGTGTSGQGNNGGSAIVPSIPSSSSAAVGAGGGGAGGAGSSNGGTGNWNGGAGGAGVNTYSSWATATSTGVSGYYAGGGGGYTGFPAGYTSAVGGAGGAGGGGRGSGSDGAAVAGTANTGSGGGGGESNVGNGGSGLIIVRYAV